MARRGRSPRPDGRRAAMLLGSGIVAALLWTGTPRLLARVPLFPVRQIEIVGLKYLAPDPIIAALRLAPVTSLFTDLRLLADRVRGVNGIADVAVDRRFPSTLEVLVREVEPAAFVPGERGLVPVDAGGRPLPLDPERSGLDLPVATRDSGVLAVLGLVQTVDPGLFQAVTAARGLPRGVVLELGARRRILLSREARPDAVRALVLVRRDLALKGRAYGELDARFAGQVIVRGRAPVRD